jgi:AraC-like DNA-binding protein
MTCRRYGPVMETVSTAQVPASDRFAFWRELNAQLWGTPYDVRCDRELERDFRAHVGVSAFGPVEATLLTSMPHSVHRTPRLIRQTDPDVFIVTCTERGAAGVARDGRSSKVQVGDMVLFDPSRPYVASLVPDLPAHRLLVLRFPRTMLSLPSQQMRELHGDRIPGQRGVMALASQFLLNLARHLHELSPADTARLSTATLDLLAEALATALDVADQMPAHARRRALLVRVHAFIRNHLADRSLTPEVIASAHHISLRYLHKLFHEEGLTVGGCVRERRLEQSRRDLADPQLASLPIAAIAARWGFGGPAPFSHAFRRRYDLSPRQFRDQVRDRGVALTSRARADDDPRE